MSNLRQKLIIGENMASFRLALSRVILLYMAGGMCPIGFIRVLRGRDIRKMFQSVHDSNQSPKQSYYQSFRGARQLIL